MNEYRAFVIGHDGKVFMAHDILAANDEAAVELAKTHVDGHDVEVWQFARRIALLRHLAD